MTSNSLHVTLEDERKTVAESIMQFDFEKKRIKILSTAQNVKENCNGIIYWMSREMRVQDNWSFLFAQKLAMKNKVPLYVIFFIIPTFLDASSRQFKFLLHGLAEVSKECHSLNIKFYLYSGSVDENLPQIVLKNNIGGVVCDFSPLRIFNTWTTKLIETIPSDVPLCQVDAHNIVPCWEASDKQEYAARTIRNKITTKLDTYLTFFPPLVKHPYSGTLNITENEDIWKKYDDAELPTWIRPGYLAGIEMLESFCSERLKQFDSKRNDPLGRAISNLSPWLHFGQVAPQRCVLEVNKFKEECRGGVNSFCEEIIIRRELADNYCYYNSNYDDFESIPNWAKTSLNIHRKDKREYLYKLEEFEKAETHEVLWNSAQLELVKEGKMHGYMRMYWAKKILEWTESPEEAIKIAIYLNDHYSFDGRDPNGYVGIMWSICGIHDQGWAERAVFGKIRYMNYNGCARKFNVSEYIKRWGGKAHKTGKSEKTEPKKESPRKKSKTK